jgi:hypothetical protein
LKRPELGQQKIILAFLMSLQSSYVTHAKNLPIYLLLGILLVWILDGSQFICQSPKLAVVA